jgi:pyruvate/2-oxoglutarate dehydrogenase complex dihydrolipoamide dehydrogenase (E3) component
MAHVQEMIYTVHEKKQLLQHLRDTDVEVVVGAGAARFVDPHTVALADGRQLQGDRFILCPGGHARRSAFPGAVGEQAVEIVHVAAAGMDSGMWVELLAELEIAYPTYTAMLGLAARRLVRELGVMPLTPEWRTLGRPHAEWERREI